MFEDWIWAEGTETATADHDIPAEAADPELAARASDAFDALLGRLGMAPAEAAEFAEFAGPPARWSDPETWGGALPGEGDVAVIEAGRTILLDTDATVAGIMVHGTLIAEDARDLSLTTDWMLVMGGGDFLVGAEDAPFLHDFTVTLTGDDPDFDLDLGALHGCDAEPDPDACPATGGTCRCAHAREDHAHAIEDNTAFLMAMGEGSTIEIHAADAAKTSWTRLEGSVPAGATAIVLAEPVTWEVGDLIAIASTDFDMHQSQTAVIAAISADGRSLTLDRPLTHSHFGEVLSYDNGTRAWEIDMRAEVALLSRNVTIQGDADSALDGLGGHTMVMDGAQMRISGAEFFRMGQEGVLGRYPAHWHLSGDAAGQVIENSSVHHSYNRAITVHGTQNATIANNVTYDIVGHAYFLEDGSETGNRFEGNLGILTRAAASAEAATAPTDFTHASTFWITNPANDFVGNVAAGAAHGGFWFAAGPSVAGASAHIAAHEGMDPSAMMLGRFEGNAAHSTGFANLAFDGHADPLTGAFVESDYRPEGVPVVHDFASWKSADRAIWVRASAMEFSEIRSADNARATFFSYNQVMTDSLIVGRSANVGTPVTEAEIAAGRSLPQPYNGKYFRGHSIYDGPSGIVNTHFAGFTDADAAFQTNGAAQKSTAHFASGLTFDAVSEAGRLDFAPQSWAAHMWSSGLVDLDGSLTGTAGATVTPILTLADGSESRFNTADGAIRRDDWGAWVVAGERFGLLRADTGAMPGQADAVLWSRADDAAVRDGGTFEAYHQTGVLLNGEGAYRLQYHDLPQDLTLTLRFGARGDAVLVELPGLPAGAQIDHAEEVADRAALMAASHSAWLREGDLVLLRLVADIPETDPRFVPQSQDAGIAGRQWLDGVTIRTPGGAPVLAEADSFDFFGETGTASLSARDLTGFDALRIEAEGAYRLMIRDTQAGLTDLGRYEGAARVDLSGLDASLRDAVDSLVFVAEGDATPALVTLEAAAIRTEPVYLAAVVPAGTTFGIVSDAIKAPQMAAAGGLSIVGVGPALGGSAVTGLPGQADHVFFTADPDFAGIARFEVTLRDAAGNEGRTMVQVEVA